MVFHQNKVGGSRDAHFLGTGAIFTSASKSETSLSSSSARALRSSAVVSLRTLLALALAMSAFFLSSRAVTNLVVRSSLPLSFARMIYSNSESWEVAGEACKGCMVMICMGAWSESFSVFGFTSDCVFMACSRI